MSAQLTMEKDLGLASRQIKELSSAVNSLTRQRDDLDHELKVLNRELSLVNKSAATNKSKYTTLLTRHGMLDKELESLRSGQEDLKRENSRLTGKIADLHEENKKTESDLRSALTTWYDGALIIATRGMSDKLVVRGRRIQKLTASLRLSTLLDDFQFRIIDPRGVPLNEERGKLTSLALSTDTNTKLVEVTFVPKKKLHAGMYKLEIVSQSRVMGSLLMKFN